MLPLWPGAKSAGLVTVPESLVNEALPAADLGAVSGSTSRFSTARLLLLFLPRFARQWSNRVQAFSCQCRVYTRQFFRQPRIEIFHHVG